VGSFPRADNKTRLISIHLNIKRQTERTRRTSPALIPHQLLRKGLLPFFCPENGCNFPSFPQQRCTLLLGLFSGSNLAKQYTYTYTLMGADCPPRGLEMASAMSGTAQH